MTELHYYYYYRIGISTISDIIQEMCKAIWICLEDECMDQPSKKRWMEISEGFLKNSDFPNCLGATDGKHVRVVKPKHSGCLYYNYKHYCSIQLLAICDANYCFTYVDIGDCGKNNYVSVYNNLRFNKKLQAGTLNIPEPAYLPGKK
jgi:hypothetical protein